MKLLGAHQNIVSLVGCCTLQEHKFLVIEYVPFGDLLQWLRRKRRSVRRFSKKNLNNLMLPRVFGSNAIHGNSVLNDSRVVLHEIPRANYSEWQSPTQKMQTFLCRQKGDHNPRRSMRNRANWGRERDIARS